MRMVHALNETVGEGAQQVKQTGVGGDAKIVYALLTGMVSDKIVYPVREYATNAWEVSPPKKPFEIELPTRFNPQYTIRDFGPGLPHSFMMNKYAKIGTISVSASREALQYDDRTETGLRALFQHYDADWMAKARAAVDAQPTYFAARRKADEISRSLGDGSWRLVGSIGWRGFAFHANLFPEQGLAKVCTWPEMDGFRRRQPAATMAPLVFKADWQVNPGEIGSRKIVIQHNTSRSLERFEAAGLMDTPCLWVRVKRADLDWALERMGRPEYIVLDDIKLPPRPKGQREKRPESVKRRKVMDLASCSTWQELVDHDDELLYVRITGRGKKLTYTLTFEGEPREFNDRYTDPLLNILRVMRKNGLADKVGGGMTCVVLGEDEAPQDHWISLGDHLVELLDEAIDPTQVAPTIPWNDTSFPQLLRQIRDRKVDLGMAPQALRDAFYEMIALTKSRETLVRDDNDHDRLAAVLLELTGTDLKTVAKDPTQPVRQAWAALLKTHPMLPLILNHNEYQQYARHGYGGYTFSKEGQKALDHYFALLAK